MHAVSRIALLAALTLVAGCGGGERPAAAIAPPEAAAPTPAVTAQPVADVVAKIADFEYKPRTLRIAKGTRVTWKNVDTANHTVTFARGPGDLGNISERGSRSARFPRAGTFTYVCEYHPSMHGKVIVS
ncbi:cupredoxin domain-containing protein [Solirubrobacter ginsenosidimutans]|uniref:Cupredoxin domain-containing protein n=1 Tax=Solirubrobacter ginsenosidimutans TaxID=490573 RepID=A0A9X3S0T5_9ACTN|nr:plastocyanin/azurin family copper-binding protein [Solirubrobacter ginsenosidimutans]MDA0161669.1 cupredoxin domain-containing protein [Solirubrobacter ginsenosidimutans]